MMHLWDVAMMKRYISGMLKPQNAQRASMVEHTRSFLPKKDEKNEPRSQQPWTAFSALLSLVSMAYLTRWLMSSHTKRCKEIQVWCTSAIWL